VREEVQRDPKRGIARAVTRTGAIITSAGIIFAGTFAALISSPLNSIAEAGTAITLGLLLDTFLVRSFVVPAVAVLLGRWNWWPSGRTPRPPAHDTETVEPQPTPRGTPHLQPAPRTRAGATQ
jgi:RND superfamily putative drug exporter